MSEGGTIPGRAQPMLFLNRFVNPFVRALLRSPVHPLASSSLAVLSYTGRRTGLRHALPVMFARDGGRIVVAAGHPERKQWWRNLRRAAPVHVLLRGRDYHGEGRLVTERGEIERGLALYLARFPRSAKSFGIALDADGRPDPSALRAAAASAVMVVIELGSTADAHERLSVVVLVSRGAHGLVSALFLASVAIVYIGAWRGTAGAWTLAAVAALCLEGLFVLLSRGNCPLAPVFRRLGDERPFFELLLPPRAARLAVPVLAGITTLGVVLLAALTL